MNLEPKGNEMQTDTLFIFYGCNNHIDSWATQYTVITSPSLLDFLFSLELVTDFVFVSLIIINPKILPSYVNSPPTGEQQTQS